MQVKRPSTVSCARTKSRAGSSPQATGPARLARITSVICEDVAGVARRAGHS